MCCSNKPGWNFGDEKQFIMAREQEQTWSDILWVFFSPLPPVGLELQDDADTEIIKKKSLLNVTNSIA